MLILSDEQVQELLTAEMCLESLENAYREEEKGWAARSPRCDILTADPEDDGQGTFHGLKSMMGTVAGSAVGAVRINSDIIRWPSTDHGLLRVKQPQAPGNRYVGLVLLFSLKTGELLSLFPDAFIQSMRVAASSALAAKYLARDDAEVLGIYGSGWQAGAHIANLAKVRNLKEVRVFSPTWERCKRFCEEKSLALNLEVVPLKEPQEIMATSDIVIACTNSLDHVVLGKRVREGMHLSCVKPGELDQEAYDRCDLIVLHNQQMAPLDFVANGRREPPIGLVKERKSFLPGDFQGIDWQELPQLCDVLFAPERQRKNPSQVTCFCNNIGSGMQFAAVGHAVFQKAVNQGVGTEMPSEWFSQINHP